MNPPLLRWTIGEASREWGTNVKTIALGLRTQGIVAEADGKYSTQQINRAINGDYEAAKTRDTNASADIREITKANLLRENIPANLVMSVWNGTLAELRQKILYLEELSEARKHEILKDLQDVPANDYFTASNPSPQSDTETVQEAA